MTAQQYLLAQAQHCRRTAEDAGDAFIADELVRLAVEFERKARDAGLRDNQSRQPLTTTQALSAC